MLQRVNYLGSKLRYNFWQALTPYLSENLVLSSRPSFKENHTDCTEYSWYIFDSSPGEPWFKTRVVDSRGQIAKRTAKRYHFEMDKVRIEK